MNDFGELGLGDTTDRLKPTHIPNIKGEEVSLGKLHTVVIDLENDVWIWIFEYNKSGNLGLAEKQNRLIPNFKAEKMPVGRYHTIIINWILFR